MTAAAPVDIGTLITRTPGVYGGRPCLVGTRFPVLQVAACYRDGMSPEQIASEYGPLDLAAVYAGVAYYLANQAAIDAELEEREALSERLAAEGPARGLERAV
ncbi:MAG: DUF433 domain-containing protein [Dehalococcoidia bacterium]|nr:DUF433 domain-containing protein [Dehalococcoidia bacterium]